MRYLAKLFTVLAVLMGGLFAIEATANADPASAPSIDPVSDAYSPWAWMTFWMPSGQDYPTTAAGGLQDGLNKTGMVIAVQPEQFAALTPADVAQLTQHWDNGGLLSATFHRSQLWSTVAVADTVAGTAAVPVWSSVDSDGVARDLGGTSYGALSAGLKSVVQRVATIVTGDFKPPMPDDGWASWMSPASRAAFDARPDTRFDWSTISVGVDGSAAVKTVCDAGMLQWACLTTKAAVSVVGAAVDFATDPLAWLTGKMAAGASGLMSWVSGVANAATAPDLTAAWWIDAYRKGAAVGVLLFGMVLMWQMFQKARGRIDAAEFMEIFTVWAPAYFLGLIFGPPLGQFLIVGAGYLSDSFIHGLSGFSAGNASDQVGAALDGAGAGTILGGAIVAFFVLAMMILAALMIFVSLAAQAVTIYLAGAVFGVALAWIVSARHRGGSLKIPYLFLGIVFSRPLLFFLLGGGLALTRQATKMSGDTAAANLATLVMAVVVLGLVGFAPLLLLKFAPVTPTGMAGGGQHGGGVSAGVGAASLVSGLAAARARRGGTRTGGAGAAAASMGGGPAGGGGGSAGAVEASATSRTISGGGAGSVSQQLSRAPRPAGGTPSAQASRIARAAPPQGSGQGRPRPAAGHSGAGGGGGSGTSGDGSGGSRRNGWPAAAAAIAAPGAAAGAMGTAKAHRLASDLDGDQRWESL